MHLNKMYAILKKVSINRELTTRQLAICEFSANSQISKNRQLAKKIDIFLFKTPFMEFEYILSQRGKRIFFMRDMITTR